ncbi:MAG: hypothetical protein Q9165_006377 [Trypethelium subeluteriae]
MEGDLERSSIGNWELAVQAIRRLLDDAHLEHVGVEIIDHQKAATSSSAITEEIFPSDRVESLYTSARLYLNESGMKWTTMTLLNRGSGSSNLRPTLLVTATDLDRNQWWTETLPELEKMCHSVSSDVDAELLHGAISCTQDMKEPCSDAINYGPNLHMGDSMGAAGSDGSGSIGAAISLRIGDDPPAAFILSNHHVTAKDQNSEDSKDGYAIRAPSDCDTVFQQATLEEMIADFRRSRDKERTRYGAKADFTERMDQRIATCQQQLARIPADANTRAIGNFYKSRQGLSRDGWFIDWSLTRLGNNRSVSSEAPSAIEAARSSKALRNSTEKEVIKLTTWSDASFQGIRIAKRGRTTGWTVGVANMYETYKASDTGTLVNPTVDQNAQGKDAKVWPVFPVRMLSESEAVLDGGDSGSIIISTEMGIGRMIGLGFGAINEVRLMSPLGAVFADIEEQVKGVVVEPRKSAL